MPVIRCILAFRPRGYGVAFSVRSVIVGARPAQ